MRHGGLVAVAAFLASCATTNAPDYPTVPDSAPHAVIENQGALGITTTTCQLPGANSICGATLLLVDGKRVSSAYLSNRVESGHRRVRLMCTLWKGGPMFFGAMTAFGKDLDVDLKPGGRYKVTGVEKDGGCDLNLTDIGQA